ncbi:hypothetical protein C2G38_2142613 [Gigaspora rosea]|uniref:Protein kinase domain-containing protein n=1 Tax=Gigaspora rosea TaxID=44941 RepID=A0A397V6Z4_9GLOM|nr:hypothetical protein C2G38_2142613 [Gigaspora rosea]
MSRVYTFGPNSTPDSEVEVYGWVRFVRVQKNVSFAAINDGSSLKGMQTRYRLKTGTCIRIRGIVTQSSGTEQNKELQAQQVEVLDLELSRKVDEKVLAGEIYGVMPYVAFEILLGDKPFTQKADIYWFGMIIIEMSIG